MAVSYRSKDEVGGPLFLVGFTQQPVKDWSGVAALRVASVQGLNCYSACGFWFLTGHILLVYFYKQICGPGLPSVGEVFEIHKRRAGRLDLCNL